MSYNKLTGDFGSVVTNVLGMKGSEILGPAFDLAESFDGRFSVDAGLDNKLGVGAPTLDA